MQIATGAALGVAFTALMMCVGEDPAGGNGSGADRGVITAALGAAAPRLAPASWAGARFEHSAVTSDPRAGEPWRIETARAEPPARSARDHDPRLAFAFSHAPIDPEAAAVAEAALDLTRRDRRTVQRRLEFAQHDPQLVDGIFGPATRAAITGWQRTMGLPPTGYLDQQALVLLEWQTEDRYRAWATAEARERRRQRTQMADAGSAAPPDAGAGKCQRLGTGEIAYGQNVRCDFRGLRENVAQLFRVADRS